MHLTSYAHLLSRYLAVIRSKISSHFLAAASALCLDESSTAALALWHFFKSLNLGGGYASQKTDPPTHHDQKRSLPNDSF
jgi:hypothetical protein